MNNTILSKIAKRKRIIASVTFFVFLFEMLHPLTSFALTSGPSTPEVASFEPATTTDMVDMFTGDFNYNLPLFEVPGPNGGYPLNLSYHAGSTMESEASWVGLGWNINVGAINRESRGLPDDFNGDQISIKKDLKSNYTIGANVGFGFELFGQDAGEGALQLGVGLYYNSYRGMGFNTSVGFNTSMGGSSGSLDLSFDTQEGVGVNPSTSIGVSKECSLQLGIGYNSKRGLTDLNFAIGSIGVQGNLNMAASSFLPSLQDEMTGFNQGFSFKIGGEIQGVHLSGEVRGYYNMQELKNKNREQLVRSYGYNYLQNDVGEDDLIDFNREKDGMIRKESPNLAIPSLTFDVYSIQGQGVGGSFRPYRNDVGAIYDKLSISDFGGYNLGSDYGAGAYGKIGIKYAENSSATVVQRWDALDSKCKFIKKSSKHVTNPDFEEVYYSINGDNSTEPIDQYDIFSNDKTIRYALDNLKNVSDKYVVKSGANISTLSSPGSLRKSMNTGYNENITSSRKPRNNMVQSFTNKEIIKANDDNSDFNSNYDITLNEFKGIEMDIDRNSSNDRKSHVGGFIVTENSGSRYVYGLPVYNLKQVDKTMSINHAKTPVSSIETLDINDPSDYHADKESGINYLEEKTTPAYTTSHLLTSVLGADYVDITNNGPSDDDLGYWVKFNYVKKNSANDPYKWRIPFYGAVLREGSKCKNSDDMASYIYGEKEVYYLASVETKSHKAVFTLEDRNDNYGVNSQEQQSGSALGAKSYRLKKLELYSKSNLIEPINSIEFKYDYSNCKKVPNQINPLTEGKLTLTEVRFKYEKKNTGALNPYKFTYYNTGVTYDKYKVDRWGNNKDYGTGNLDRDKLQYNYVDQNENIDPLDRQQNISEWNLKTIQTPSGNILNIEYEPDDYSHVQNKVANQMFKIVGFGKADDDLPTGDMVDDNVLYNPDWGNGGSEVERRIYFELEKPINGSVSLSNANEQVINQYIKPLNTVNGQLQVYFKTLINMRSPNGNDASYKDFLSGYLDLDATKGGVYGKKYGILEEYKYGYIVVAKATVAGKEVKKGHPISVKAWQYLKTNLSDIAYLASSGIDLRGDLDGNDLQSMGNQMLSFFPQVANMFKGYFKTCFIKQFANQCSLENSWIRLASPDLRKFGGGYRVKSITMSDNWTFDGNSPKEYGVVYDYRAKDQSGKEIGLTSGIAQYEPILGGDEIALRYAKTYPEVNKLNTNNDLYFEFPINESYMPSPIVGYSRVEVRTKATDDQLKNLTGSGILGTGATVHEFYTAKDFPVITDETSLEDNSGGKAKIHQKYWIPIPFFGEISQDHLTVSQGYKIELNDMHGKLKSLTYYPQLASKLVDYLHPVSSVRYNYRSATKVVENEPINVLVNQVDVLVGDGQDKIQHRNLGYEMDVFHDFRESKTKNKSWGLSANLDVISIGFPCPLIVPSFNVSKTDNNLRMAVTNKVIYRSGILESIKATDGESTVFTKNIYYDALTGAPLVTQVNNNFDKPIYNYSIPAFWSYENMGPAYINSGMYFNAGDINNIEIVNTVGTKIYFKPGNIVTKYLYPGDEFYSSADVTTGIYAPHLFTVLAVDKIANTATIVCHDLQGLTFPTSEYSNVIANNLTFTISRSGRRNEISDMAGSITAMSNPIVNRSNDYCKFSSSVSDPTVIETTVYDECVNNLFLILNYMIDNNLGNLPQNHFMRGLYPICFSSTGLDITKYDMNILIGKSCLYSFFDGVDPIAYTDIVRFTSSPIFVNNTKCNIYADINYGGETTNRLITVEVQSSGDYDCSFPTHTVSRYSTTDASCDLMYFDKINNVLSASARTFNNSWGMDHNAIEEDVNVTTGTFSSKWNKIHHDSYTNPYRNGEMGIARAVRDYLYVDTRKQTNESTTNTNVDISKDGTFDNMPMFSWSNPMFTNPDCNKTAKWRSANQITQYSPYNYETENKNALNINSTALYSYKGKMAIAISSNARKNEIGFENFEEYNPADPSEKIHDFNNATGNLDITTYETNLPKIISEPYNIFYGMGNKMILDVSYGDGIFASSINNKKVKIVANTGPQASTGYVAESVMKVCKILSTSTAAAADGPGCAGKIKCVIEQLDPDGNSISPSLAGPGFTYSNDNRCWNGVANILTQIGENNTTTNPAQVFPFSGYNYTTAKAHTGKVSFKVSGSQSHTPMQRELKLIPGKKYIVSVWVSMDNTDVYTYDQPNISTPYLQLVYNQKVGGTIDASVRSTKFYPKGEIINGWQKIEAEFTIPTYLPNPYYCTSIVLFKEDSRVYGGSPANAYFDDLRIFPADASFVSYVYNNKTLKLEAVLDNNNYAQLYSYDEEGNLFLVRKETSKGIITIQESRKNLKTGN